MFKIPSSRLIQRDVTSIYLIRFFSCFYIMVNHWSAWLPKEVKPFFLNFILSLNWKFKLKALKIRTMSDIQTNIPQKGVTSTLVRSKSTSHSKLKSVFTPLVLYISRWDDSKKRGGGLSVKILISVQNFLPQEHFRSIQKYKWNYWFSYFLDTFHEIQFSEMKIQATPTALLSSTKKQKTKQKNK